MWEALGRIFLGPLVDAGVRVFEKHTQGQVDKEKLRVDLQKSFGEVFRDVAKSDNELAAKMYGSFQETLRVSQEIRAVWRIVVLVQLFVIFWYQMVVPAMVTWGLVERWASAGSTVDWAYALLGGCVGLAPVVLKPRPPKIV